MQYALAIVRIGGRTLVVDEVGVPSAEAENRVPAMAGAMVHPARDEDGFLLKDPRYDGAVSLRYGSVDAALGWPLRYLHSTAYVINTRDLKSLAKFIMFLGKNW